MKYSKTVTGKFIDRPNRFIAHVEVDGKIKTVHVKNTGRCKELLLPGVKVVLEDFSAPQYREKRKTEYDLIAVYKQYENKKETLLINMDSQAPNKAVYEWLKTSESFDFIKSEYVYGSSRIDFYMEKGSEKYLLEIKGCTLEKNGTGFFPDAPTERGVKHLKELTEAVKKGYKAAVGFVIQMEGIKEVLPNVETHKEFGKALEEAEKNGVKVIYFLCSVKEDTLSIVSKIIK